MDAKDMPPGDTSKLASLGRHLGAGVGVVLGVALAFFGIGELSGAPASEVVIDEVGSPGDEQDTPADPESPESPASASPAPQSPTPTTSPPVSEPAETPSSPSPSPDQVDPGEISIQVLDGVGDGGATAAGVAEALAEAGFDVFVTNPAAVAYEQTTVFFTDGQQAAAQQVATTMGYGVVEEAPDNVSESIDVHVVVGTDQS